MLTTNIADMRREMREHIEADKLIGGQYWKGGRGCFIGCLTHSGDGSAAPVEARFGVPQPITKIAENIFEALWRVSPDRARKFALDLIEAIGGDGRDLSRVHWAFLGGVLRHLPEQEADTQGVIDKVIAGMELLASGSGWTPVKVAQTTVAATATAAADAAARAAEVADTAWAAAEADAAAVAAEWAEAAGMAGAGDVRDRQAALLINLIKDAQGSMK